MILINLLPHREEKRKRRKTAFFVGLGVSAVVGFLLSALVYVVLQQLAAEQQSRNQYLKLEINRLEVQIKDIAELRAEIESLKARQSAVENLQADRNTPVHLLNELARYTPEGVYLTSIRQVDKTVTVTGIAQTNERVSEFLRNTARSSEWLERPELVEIKVANLTTNNREQKRLFDFSLRVSIKQTQPASQAGTSSAVKSTKS